MPELRPGTNCLLGGKRHEFKALHLFQMLLKVRFCFRLFSSRQSGTTEAKSFYESDMLVCKIWRTCDPQEGRPSVN